MAPEDEGLFREADWDYEFILLGTRWGTVRVRSEALLVDLRSVVAALLGPDGDSVNEEFPDDGFWSTTPLDIEGIVHAEADDGIENPIEA